MKFLITGNGFVELGTARATGYSHAANVYARRRFGRQAIAYRTTGDNGKSGWFRAYVPLPARSGGGLTSVGNDYHVTCELKVDFIPEG